MVISNRLTGGHEDLDSEANLDYEVFVVGAGVAGSYQIKRLIDMGIRAVVLEADPDLGGTWYNNRYPGARYDSESYTYCLLYTSTSTRDKACYRLPSYA